MTTFSIFLVTQSPEYPQRFDDLLESLELQLNCKCTIYNIYNQRCLPPQNFLKGFSRVVFEDIFTFIWNMRNKTSRSIFLLLPFLRNLILNSFLYLASRKYRSKLRTRYIVTSKHYYAIESISFLDFSYGLILEEDFFFTSTASLAQQITGLIPKLKQPCYVDIAGGYGDQLLFSSKKPLYSTDTFQAYEVYPKQSNTACGYLVDKSFAVNVHNLLLSCPSLRYLIGNDFIINLAFMTTNKSAQCIHFLQSVARHGSFSGDTRSWTLDPQKKLS